MIPMSQVYTAQIHYYDLRREAKEPRLAGGNRDRPGIKWLTVWLMLLKLL